MSMLMVITAGFVFAVVFAVCFCIAAVPSGMGRKRKKRRGQMYKASLSEKAWYPPQPGVKSGCPGSRGVWKAVYTYGNAQNRKYTCYMLETPPQEMILVQSLFHTEVCGGTAGRCEKRRTFFYRDPERVRFSEIWPAFLPFMACVAAYLAFCLLAG